MGNDNFTADFFYSQVNVSDYVGIVNHTSHPHIMNDGTVYNMGLSVTPRGPMYNIVCFSSPRIIIGRHCSKIRNILFDISNAV